MTFNAYREAYGSFLHWSRRFSADGQESPYNAVLMLAACQVMMLAAGIQAYEIVTDRSSSLGRWTFVGLAAVLAAANFIWVGRKSLGLEMQAASERNRALAPLLAIGCLVALIVPAIWRL